MPGYFHRLAKRAGASPSGGASLRPAASSGAHPAGALGPSPAVSGGLEAQSFIEVPPDPSRSTPVSDMPTLPSPPFRTARDRAAHASPGEIPRGDLAFPDPAPAAAPAAPPPLEPGLVHPAAPPPARFDPPPAAPGGLEVTLSPGTEPWQAQAEPVAAGGILAFPKGVAAASSSGQMPGPYAAAPEPSRESPRAREAEIPEPHSLRARVRPETDSWVYPAGREAFPPAEEIRVPQAAAAPVHVRIGAVTVEIHQPTAPARPASPPPPPAPFPAARRPAPVTSTLPAAGFKPSRHYLRG